MEENPVLPADSSRELRRTTLVPLCSSALAMVMSWTIVVLSFFPDACQSIYDWTGKDFEPTRYVFMFTGVLFTACFIVSWRAWRKART